MLLDSDVEIDKLFTSRRKAAVTGCGIRTLSAAPRSSNTSFLAHVIENFVDHPEVMIANRTQQQVSTVMRKLRLALDQLRAMSRQDGNKYR